MSASGPEPLNQSLMSLLISVSFMAITREPLHPRGSNLVLLLLLHPVAQFGGSLVVLFADGPLQFLAQT